MALPDPYYQDDAVTLYHGECEAILPHLPKVALILTDPPYYKQVAEEWDKQWKNPAEFFKSVFHWRDLLFDRLQANGSLYWFASAEMAARVEVALAERFTILNHLIWTKANCGGTWRRMDRTTLRAYIPETERILFAEHQGADNRALGESGYRAECDGLRGHVFEPLRKYLADERDAAGFKTHEIAVEYQKKTGSRTVTGMAGHWFESSQWALPTKENYHWLRGVLMSRRSGQYLRREYEDLRREYEDLRREYEDLRREYEDLRRPFTANPHRYTDIFDIAPPSNRNGHPCEKPLQLIVELIENSTRPGDLVVDPFGGSGTTAEAAKLTGRKAIVIERDVKWLQPARARCLQEVLL